MGYTEWNGIIPVLATHLLGHNSYSLSKHTVRRRQRRKTIKTIIAKSKEAIYCKLLALHTESKIAEDYRLIFHLFCFCH